jgi:uncharacterized iron-regulated membrane protein
MSRPRRIVMRLHLWLGLGLGALFVLAGLTGSLLVYYVEIDRWLHPEQASQGMADAAAFDAAITTVREAWPDKQGPWRIEVTDRPGAIPMRYYHPPETAGRSHAPMLVWLSSDGRQVLRRDFWGDSAMTWIYDLHYQLKMDKPGGTLMGIAGLALLALLVSGLWAWWPRGSWAKALRFKRGAGETRRLRDLHKLTGLAGLPLLAMLAATGAMLALPGETRAVLAPLLGKPAEMPAPHSRAASGRQIAPSAALAAARAAMPRARPAWIEIPGAGDGAYRLRLQQPADPSRRFPKSFVWVDPYRGNVIARHDAATFPALSVLEMWLHPLHDGSAGGQALRIAVMLAGLLPLGLFLTGLLRWRARNRRKVSPKVSPGVR